MVLLTFPILLSLAAFGLGWGSALRIEIQHPTYAEGSSGPVNVSCEIDHQDSDADEIPMMKIIKDGEKPLVVLRQSGIQLGSGVNPSMFLREGLINRKDISTSYMKLGILDPTSQDEGKYTCFMLFVDKHHQVSERRASANFVKLTLNDVIMKLRGQVATLEGKWEAQTSKLEAQTSKLEAQTSKLEAQTSKLEAQTLKVDGLRKENQNQKERMKDMAATVSYSTYFTAYLKKGSVDVTDDTIVFDNVMANEGMAYNGSTGLFTAPRDGLYAFHVTLMTKCGNCFLQASIMKDNVIVARLWGRDKGYQDQTSTSYLGLLDKGDRVRVKTYGPNQLYGGYYNLFSGYLVRAD